MKGLKLPTLHLNLNKEQKMIGIGVAAVILALIPSVYFYNQYQKAQQRLSNPNQLAAEEVKKIVEAAGKLIDLPADETPTVATVNDREKLKNQQFFSRAENGDKVLIYTNAKKAILYRPSINKIIEVAPVNIGGNATPSAEPTVPQVRAVLLNGTTVVGLTRTFETQLKEKAPQVVIADRDNAKKRDYAKSVIVDVTGKNKVLVTDLGKTLGLTVDTLPSGEATPSSDILIILGADKK